MNDSAVLGNDGMTTDEREEFTLLAAQYERGRLRNQMAEGARGYTHLVYVKGANGQIIKMPPDAADKYVELNEGAEIVDRGTREMPKEGVIVGAAKATVGAMFDDNGRQIASVQPMTTATFLAHDGVREEVHTPAIGAAGAEINNPAGSMSPTGTRRIARVKPAETAATNDVITSASASE